MTISIDTRQSLKCGNFEQCNGVSLTLSGATKIASTGVFNYLTDQSGTFTKFSIVDKNYVTGLTATLVNSANNGLNKIGNNIRLGGALTGNTSLTGVYTLNICGGTQLNTVLGYQISGSTILRTAPNNITSIYLGQSAGNNTSTGVNNIAFGCQALACNSTGNNNFAVGCQSLCNNTTGCNNIAIGAGALVGNLIGGFNTAIGFNVNYCGTGDYNSIVGSSALRFNYGSYNAVVGNNALLGNPPFGSSSCFNSVIGSYGMQGNCNGNYNSAVGYMAGYSNVSGNSNVFIGVCAGYNETKSNRLYISSGATRPLIYGEFDNRKLIIDGSMCVTKLPTKSSETNIIYIDTAGKLSSGATAVAGITTANNGLTAIGNNVRLGGALTGNTNITGNYSLNICNGAKLNTVLGYQISGSTILRTAPNNITSIYLGQSAGNNTSTGVNNIAFGSQALCCITTGCNNIANGYQALYSNTIGCDNVAIGYYSLYSNTGGTDNIAFGCQSMYCNTKGNYNVAIGKGALSNNISGCNNVANGYRALFNNTTGNYNIANGYSALGSNTIGNNNIANGYSALGSNTIGNNNIANGNYALYSNTGGTNNIALGCQSLYFNTKGTDNVANGYQALYNNTCGCNNIANGNNTLRLNTIGCYNIATGYKAAYSNITGSTNIFLGTCAGYSETKSNRLYISSGATRPLIYGEFDNRILSVDGKLGVGTTTFDGTNPEKFIVNAGITSSVNVVVGTGSINGYLQSNIKNISTGTGASSDIIATADNGNETTNYIDMGINGSAYTGGVFGAANDAYLYNLGQNMYVGTGTASKNLVFVAGGTNVLTNSRMTILGSNGYVGINNPSPSARFDVSGNTTIRGCAVITKLPAKSIETNIVYIDAAGKLSSGATSSGGGYSVSVISGATNAVKNYLYVFTASLTLTLPASPSAGDSIKISNMSNTKTSTVARNGLNIMGLTQDLTVDTLNIGLELIYTNATYGWIII